MRSGARLERFLARARYFLLEALSRRQPTRKVLDRINRSVPETYHLLWVGAFKELCRGNGRFPLQLRAEFLGEVEEEPRAIEEEETEEFVELLALYEG